MNKAILKVILKRMLYSVLLLFLLVTFIFILLRLSPGDPVNKYVSPFLNPQLSENLREEFGLNNSVTAQYFTFLQQSFTGNFGISFNYRIPVTEVIAEYLPFTIVFALICFTVQIFFSILLSLSAAKRKGSFSDKLISTVNLVFYALPAFFIGVLLIFLFSELLQIFPSSGLRSYNHDALSTLGKLADMGWHLVLPVVSLSAAGTAVLYRYLRENMDEIFNADYVLFLKSNGVAASEIIRGHVLPNALSPLISVAGIELGFLLSGALITEVIFGLPGMGRLTVQAILMRDYPLVTGCAVFSGALIILSNFLADLVKLKLDKRLLSKGILN
jgi:peptide/nickel transport system permease protein